jgi:hypothetical protein
MESGLNGKSEQLEQLRTEEVSRLLNQLEELHGGWEAFEARAIRKDGELTTFSKGDINKAIQSSIRRPNPAASGCDWETQKHNPT